MASKREVKGLTIGELADQAGIGVETVRYYEKEGLLDQPLRPIGSFRTYEQDAVDRLGFVHEAKELGFTLKEIRDLIALRSNPATDAAAVRGRAVAKLTQVERKLMQFERMRATLRDLLANCPGSGDLSACPIVQALSVSKTSSPADAASRRGGRATRGIDMKTVEMTIKGMHCEGCAKTIESVLKGEPGVKAATISHATGNARVMFDPEATDLPGLVKAVERAGFQVPQTK